MLMSPNFSDAIILPDDNTVTPVCFQYLWNERTYTASK